MSYLVSPKGLNVKPPLLYQQPTNISDIEISSQDKQVVSE